MSQEEIPTQPPLENGSGEPAGAPPNPGAPPAGAEVPAPPPPPEAEVPGTPAVDEGEESTAKTGKDADQSPVSSDPNDPVEERRPAVTAPDRAIQPTEGGSADSEADIEDLPPMIGKGGSEGEVPARDVAAARKEGLQDEVARLEAEGSPRVLKTSKSREIGRGAVLKAAGGQPSNGGVGGTGRIEANPKAPGSIVRHG